jgi:hypothetical protein
MDLTAGSGALWPAVTVLFAALTALSAAVAAWASMLSARRLRRTQEAQALITLAQAFGSPEMTEAHATLLAWKQKHGENFAADYAGRLQALAPDAAAVPLDEEILAVHAARRLVAHHYQVVDYLTDSKDGAVRPAFIWRLVAADQAQFYREIIEPMEAALNDKYEHKSFDRIGKHYKIPRYAKTKGGLFH